MNADQPTPRELVRLFEALSTDARPRDGCPSPDRIWDAVRGELPAAEVESLVDHTSGCGICAEAWRLAREIGPPPLVGSTPRPISTPIWLALGVAATFLIAVTGVYLLRDRPLMQEPVYRESDEASIRSLLDETIPLPRDQFVLRWSPGPAGTTYTVRVTREDLSPIEVAQVVQHAEHRVPPNLLAPLPRSARVLWQVEATLPGGGRSVSPTFIAVLQ